MRRVVSKRSCLSAECPLPTRPWLRHPPHAPPARAHSHGIHWQGKRQHCVVRVERAVPMPGTYLTRSRLSALLTVHAASAPWPFSALCLHRSARTWRYESHDDVGIELRLVAGGLCAAAAGWRRGYRILARSAFVFGLPSCTHVRVRAPPTRYRIRTPPPPHTTLADDACTRRLCCVWLFALPASVLAWDTQRCPLQQRRRLRICLWRHRYHAATGMASL